MCVWGGGRGGGEGSEAAPGGGMYCPLGGILGTDTPQKLVVLNVITRCTWKCIHTSIASQIMYIAKLKMFRF